MTDQATALPASGTLPAMIKILLIPSWVVGLGAALIGLDLKTHIVPGSIAPIIGNTVLVGGFLIAPLATLLAAVLAIWHSLRNRHRAASPAGRRGIGVWPLIGLSFLCLVGAMAVTASFFTS